MSKVKSYGLKAYVSKAFGLDVGSQIKRSKRNEEEKEHIYEVKQLFPHCVLLEDIYDRTRICPCYSKLSLMLIGIE